MTNPFVNIISSTPDSWSRPLKRRVVVYDPLHAEMIGYDVPEDEMGPEDEGPPQEDIEEQGQEEEMEAVSAPGGGGGGGGGSFAPTAPPAPFSFPVFDQPAAQQAAANVAQKLAEMSPTALNSITKIVQDAQSGSPSAPVSMNVLKAISKQLPTNLSATLTPNKALSISKAIGIRGDVAPTEIYNLAPHLTSEAEIVGEGAVTDAVSRIVKLTLSPAAWALRTTGNISQKLGTALQKLSKEF